MTGTRNPSRKYFTRNQPYFYKSADNWEEWDTDEKYDRTFFIGVDDSNPEDIDVALYMIWGGKPVAVVGDKVLDTISGTVGLAEQLETEIQSILEEVQELAAAVAQSEIDIEEAVATMNELVDRCEGILEGAEAARDLAKEWATKMDGMVEEDDEPVDYSAKYYANEASGSATAAAGSASAASDDADLAEAWATKTDGTVDGSEYSSKYYAGQSADSATTAAGKAGEASASATLAFKWATQLTTPVEGGEYSAKKYAQDAGTSATNAGMSETNAGISAGAASGSATAAANSATLAQDWAVKMDGQVASTDYSSKYYAGQAANSASYVAGVEANIHSIVDDAAQTLSERLNTPFFFGQSMYSENAPYNASWLASNGQYNASSLYPDFWVQLTGVELNNSLNVGDTIEISGKTYVKRGLPVVLSTGTITDYDFVVNQNDQTFRLPLLNGEEDLPDYNNGITSAVPYTTTQNGFANVNISAQEANSILYVNGYVVSAGGGSNYCNDQRLIFVRKGSTITNANTISSTIRFFPAVGNGTLYYYVGDTVQDSSLINAGAVLGQLSNKADINAGNFSSAGKSYLSGLGYPSDSYIDVTVLASDSNYTAPANGWFNTRWNSNSSTLHFIQFRDGANTHIKEIRYYSISVGSVAVISTYVRKGQQIKMRYDGASSECEYFRFYYAEGETNV